AIFARDDLSDWIYTYQLTNGKGEKHALARWRATHSLPWLIAAMKDLPPNSTEAPALMEAANRVAPSHPGYLVAQFYRLRWMLDTKKAAEARAELDQILQAKLPPSTVNAFRSLRMRAAPTMNEFFAFSGRRALLLADYDNNLGETPPFVSDA